MADGVIRVDGMPELLRKLDPAKIAGAPARRFLSRWGLTVEREGKRGAPVWRGMLRRSITHEVDPGPFPTKVRAGTNVPYAPYMEFGTGTLSDGPGGGRPHYPPARALELWGAQHGFTAEMIQGELVTPGMKVASVIGNRGGLKPRRYMRDGADKANARIPVFLDAMARDIEAQAEAS